MCLIQIPLCECVLFFCAIVHYFLKYSYYPLNINLLFPYKMLYFSVRNYNAPYKIRFCALLYGLYGFVQKSYIV